MPHTTNIITTADGSKTIYSKELGEHYHSTNGALQESMHIFINEGLLHYLSNNQNKKQIHIFEMGFGTGLNALLALKTSIDTGIEIHYESIEKYPISSNTADELNYGQLLKDKAYIDYFKHIHSCKWNRENRIGNFYLNKISGDITEYPLGTAIEVVFYDAFSPNVQEILWSIDIFSKLYKAMIVNGILTTYSSKGSVRRNLQTSGFRVEKIAGPQGKRHIVRATKEK